jgi:iron complex outermembrane receptor protein
VATGLTNQDGAYRITNIAAGTYTVTASAAGFKAGTSAPVTVQAGQTVTANLSLETAVFQLSEVVATVSKRVEKALEAPARTEVIGATELENRPTPSVVDHMRGIAAVDVISQGLQSSNVVVRGFNNIFSGALHTLTDNRIAGVPSLRVNVLNFVPSTNDDLDRMEVVLGPGSALYGPNTANGVLHMITKSPLGEPVTTLSLAGGERSVFMGAFRTSQHFSENLAFKISGQYFQGDEWDYVDGVEAAEKTKFGDPFWKMDLIRATGISSQEADRRISRIGNRDFSLERWSGEARVDWRASPDLRTIFATGRSNASQIEATGLGAAQAQDWTYAFYQARTNYKRLFVQGYLNASDAGDTYLLRNGTPIVDRSKLWVGQVQHGFDIGQRQTFTYGADLLFTNPETEGTINGKYEDDDKTTEIGVYVQSETVLSPRFDLVLAGRVDDHTALPDAVFSPRAGLVFKPADNQSFRLTYNRAFSTPSSLNQFLDLPTAAPVPSLARLGYSVRVQGSGRDTGFRFRQGNGAYLMRSPFTPGALGGPVQLLPADVTPFWAAAVQVVAAGATQAGQPIDPQLLQYLLNLQPTAAQIGTNYLNPANSRTGELSALDLPDIKPIREETSSTIELGYQGQLGERFVLAADVWFSKRENLITPLTTQTPLLLLNGPATGQYLVTRLVTDLGMPLQQAQTIAGLLVPNLAMVPLGVISSLDVNANGAQLLASYANVDREIDLWGADFSATFLLTDQLALNASTSIVNDDLFEYVVGSDTTNVPLNAPKFKAAGSLTYRDPARPFGGELRVRHTAGFPANSGVYQGTACLSDTPPTLTVEPCVEAFTLLDLVANYKLPFAPGAGLDLSVQNIFDSDYRSFPGVPTIGRFAMLRLRYQF